MKNKALADLYAAELQAEYTATQECLEKIPESVYSFKPHPKSMEMGYLALLVAEIPQWLVHIIRHGVVDFTTYQQFKLSTGDALLKHFEKCFKDALETVQQAPDTEWEGDFVLRNGEQKLWTTSKKEAVGSSINHWIHHRGQLTVYMRLNDIPVPSIYGPSADDNRF